ncbi:hypothetical protein [Actinomyces sp. oral taxon 181]|uniref:hypothetical protein n=1 Tax=Actinomyces sp. oral taxon 181 TaxID=712121 RepID=UPI0025C24EE6|nr:hypothetical protein [Actinomyces sp. oral taxon 181]MBS5750651.1 hypothetical protein [Actinomyces sp. oral taxon 181]
MFVVLIPLTVVSIGLFMWWIETYTDSPLAVFWRAISSASHLTRGFSVRIPLFCLGGLIVCTSVLAELSGVPQWTYKSLRLFGYFLFAVAAAYFLPLPVPHCVDANWQWHKRRGLIDEKGNIIPTGSAIAETSILQIENTAMTLTATCTPPSRWHSLATSAIQKPTRETLLLALTGPDDPNARFTSTITLTVSPINTIPQIGDLTEALRTTIPGWITLEEIPSPRPPGAIMCTGIYIDEGTSFTSIQFQWATPTTPAPLRFTATLTTTTHLFPACASDIFTVINTLKITQ